MNTIDVQFTTGQASTVTVSDDIPCRRWRRRRRACSRLPCPSRPSPSALSSAASVLSLLLRCIRGWMVFLSCLLVLPLCPFWHTLPSSVPTLELSVHGGRQFVLFCFFFIGYSVHSFCCPFSYMFLFFFLLCFLLPSFLVFCRLLRSARRLLVVGAAGTCERRQQGGDFRHTPGGFFVAHW